MKHSTIRTPQIRAEFSHLELGEKLNKRCRLIVDRIVDDSAIPFTHAMEGDSEVRGFYRFCANRRVNLVNINTSHFKDTAARCDETADVIVCHDTTAFCPPSASKDGGFDEITTDTYGVNLHVALASDLDNGLPLGIADARIVNSPTESRPVKGNRAVWRDPNKQSRRWFETVENIEERVDDPDSLIHVMDTEADSYEAFAHMAESRFVIRLKHNRKLDSNPGAPGQKLFDALDSAPVKFEREIVVSRRKKSSAPKRKRNYPEREKRRAMLEVRAQAVTLKRHDGLPDSMPETLEFNAVAVREPDPPDNAEPISWNLLTTEPIASSDDVRHVVDLYCQRWKIEDFFDVLKNGCNLSDRRPESRQTAGVMIGVLLTPAWELLWLRQLERTNCKARADQVFSKQRIRILRAKLINHELPSRPSVRHIVDAIAHIGGHLSHNGPPGWRIMWRGYKEFLDFERGWMAAQNA